MKSFVSALLLSIAVLISCKSQTADIAPNPVVPSAQQIEYQKMEFIGFIHFTVNTFTDREWGSGAEDPNVFNPTELNTDQWARVAKEAGMKQLILTAKHHDGFCLWPSKYTKHSVKYSKWKDGQGDVVGDFVRSCQKSGLKIGLYLSPWDRNHPEYAGEGYLTYYRNQLKELLDVPYKVSEIWFDGANGGSGYYGGANETRKIDRKTYYKWPEIWKYVKSMQPGILIFSDAGPDIRWIGNEHGTAGKTNWSMINADEMIIGEADTKYLNSGDPNGRQWVVGECDVSIRPGWFYHQAQDDKVKSPQQLIDIYYKSVGRNGTFLLNLPPDQRGLIHENDIKSLKEFRKILSETFKINLALNKKATADNVRNNNNYFSAQNIVDKDLDSYWAVDDDVRKAEIVIDLGGQVEFDRIMLQEPIRFGQRIAAFSVEAMENGKWREIAAGTTVGYKRLLRINPLKTDRVKIVIKKANNLPALSNFGLYKASAAEEN